MPQATLAPSKMRTSRLLLGLSLCLSWFLGAPTPIRAETASVRVQPESSSVSAGQTVDVQFVILQVTDLYGIDIQVDFDANLLEVVDSDANREGVQAISGQFPYPDFVAENDADNSIGEIRYVVTQLNPRTPAAGSGTIMTVRFRGKAAGASTLEIQRADLVTASALQIEAEVTWGEVTVHGSSETGVTPSPTAVLLPTQAPTSQSGASTPAQPTPTSASAAYPGGQATGTVTPQVGTTVTPSGAYPIAPTPPNAPGMPTSIVAPSPTAAQITESTAQPSAPTVSPATVAPQATQALAPTTSQPAKAPSTPVIEQPRKPSAAPTVLGIAPPTAAPAKNPPIKRIEPLIPQDLFVCFSVTLFLFTTALAVYLVRRQQDNRQS